ncbi:hypothetical protein D3C72_1742670 [compost metagenome]
MKVINLKTKDEIAAIAKVEMDSEVVEEEGEEVAENDSNNPEFKVKPQTGNNQINIGDEEELKKIEDEEATDNADEIEDNE